MNQIRKQIALMLCLAAVLGLFGCSQIPASSNVTTQAGGSAASSDGTTNINPTSPMEPSQPEDPTHSEDEKIYAMLFDIRNQVTLSLDMSDEELAKMQADYEKYAGNGSKSPIYRKADLTVTITTPEGQNHTYFLEEVGVRMKGNTSRTSFYSKDEGIYNVIHLKLSFQETFDKEAYYGNDAKTWEEAARKARKDRTFATLEKIDLRWNRCDDGSYLKEYFAYQTYRQYGVLAPMTNLCSFDWAGIHMGVFTINEPIDKIFLDKNLPQEALGGDLYKVGWAGWDNGSFLNTNSIGIEDEDEGRFYAYDLKTNKKTSNHESLIAFIKEMNSGTITKERFAELVDPDNFLAFAAVSYLLGNPDDMRNNYNNFYLYFRADTGQAMFIPYDYDRCLGVTAHWNPTGDGVTGDNPFTDKLAATNEDQRNPVLLYSVVEGGYYVREYAAMLETITAGEWFTYEKFASLYQIAEDHYATLAKPGKSFYNTDGLHMAFDLERTSDFSSNGNISFREYLDAKKKTLKFYLADVDKYADKEPTVTAVWYIRADKTDWQNDEDYAMTVEDGCITITIRASGEIRLKVYNDQTGAWYGTECIPEDCTVPFDSDKHTNIVLQAGTYRITFDPESEIITLEMES